MITVQLFRDRDLDTSERFRTLVFPLAEGTFLARNVRWFRSERLNDRVSSLSTTSTAGEPTAAMLYLFQHENYKGRFLALPIQPGDSVVEPDLRTHDLDNRASSLLLIRRHPNECVLPLNLTEMFISRIASLVDTLLPVIAAESSIIRRARQRRLPEVTWDLFPDFDPLHQLLKVRVFIEVDPEIRIVRDRDITLTIWFALVPADDGTLTASWVRQTIDADRGLVTADVVESLARGKVLEARGNIEATIQAMLRNATRGFPDAGFNIMGMYLMAARRLPLAGGETPFTGDLEDSNIFLFLYLDRPFTF